MSPVRHIILHLDVATDNLVPIDAVRARLPADAEVRPYRMTEFGAERFPEGVRTDGWHRWARSFDAMLARARAESPSDEYQVEYHVVGRGALPLAAYAGLALSGSARVTVHNPRKRTTAFDSFRLEQPRAAPSEQPFFSVERMQRGGFDTDGVVALCIGLGQGFSEGVVVDFLRGQGSGCCALVELNASTEEQVVLDEEAAPAAMWQITRVLTELHNRFPRRRGVALFCAGPLSLAVMAGWAMPNYLRPIWLPNHDRTAQPPVYRPALNYPQAGPRRMRPRILILSASPQNEAAVDLQTELRLIEETLTTVRNRCDIINLLGFRGRDLAAELQRSSPDVVHVLCHGTDKSGLVAVHPGTLKAAEIISREVVEAFEHAELPPRVVILHACHSAATAEALTRHVDTAIGVARAIAQKSAAEFTREFYGALAAGYDVRRAYDRAKLHLGMEATPGVEDIEAFYAAGGDRGAWIPFPKPRL
ncbi:SAVED domain-containing protein [Nannocystis exedens]|uniref:SAVED domain-containing protein n=1 Tax=Nannocystis exedens TaxID=54 RepID=UPI000BBA00BB|nr:SAVED domain-containing protein [Nannocystis exedens]PCC74671.1 CHAT domain protein [Nannocystis exedens]